MSRLRVNHVTEYRYSTPVHLGEHRLLFRPRDSHDLRLVSTKLQIKPTASIRWIHDVFQNSVAIANFTAETEYLRFESEFLIEHFGLDTPKFTLDPEAVRAPFAYSGIELPDLQADMLRHGEDQTDATTSWARSFLEDDGSMDTVAGLTAMAKAIHRDFGYEWRDEGGVREAAETLACRSGSCRDFALLMMEAARSLGMAARFVTGYLYDPALDNGPGDGTMGGGATHAWCQIYLPGMGWTEFDPTNGRVGGTNLVRVGVARTPEQAKPLGGTFVGPPGTQSRMEVAVSVSRLD